MVNTETIRTIVGIIGNVISFGLFVSPVPTFIKIYKSKSVLNFKPDPYLATALNCAVWLLYGMPFVNPGNFLVITINSIGLSIELVYVIMFLIYSSASQRKKIGIVFGIEVVFFVVMILLTLKLLHTISSRTFMVGIVCVVINIIMYAAPLTVVQRVIKTKSVKYMPFSMSLASLLNGIIWIIYALLKFDFFILFPNTLGAISSVVQIILYAIYYKTTNWDEEDDADAQKPPKEEVQLADAV